MDGPFLVQFVDQISATPTLRLDVCGDIWSLTTDSDLSPPALERAYAGSLLADGRPVTSAAYGNRLLRLELLLLAGASEDQAAIHVQRLSQELSRPANILRWQPGTSQPVFFRTLRGEFGKVYWDPVEKRCSVLIPAEPFAYGVKETLPSATVYPDPATPSPPLNANPYFETNTTGWSPTSATVARSTVRAHEGVASMLLTTTGTPVQAYARAEVPVVPGMSYVASVWCYSVAGYADVNVSIDWLDAAHAYLFTSLSGAALGAGTWTWRAVTGAAPANAAFAQFGPTLRANPPAGTQAWFDEAQIGVVGSSDANGCYFDITGVKGDVETPAILRVPGTTLAGLTSVFATRRRGTPSATAFLVQAETLTLQTDTSMPGNDALLSGTDSNYTRTSFATVATMRTRVNGFVSLLPASTDMRGTYRVLARMRHSIAADIIQVRLTWGQGITKTANDPVTLHTTGAVDPTGLHYYDLGLIQMPPGADPVHDGYSGIELAVDPSQITVDAARVSGAGNLDIDHLLILPADDRLLFCMWPSPAGDQLVLDGSHEMVVSMLTSGGTRIYGPPPASLSGGFPMLAPGVTNRIYYVRRVNSGLVGQGVLTGTQVFSPEYYPRYLYVRPVAS